MASLTIIFPVLFMSFYNLFNSHFACWCLNLAFISLRLVDLEHFLIFFSFDHSEYLCFHLNYSNLNFLLRRLFSDWDFIHSLCLVSSNNIIHFFGSVDLLLVFSLCLQVGLSVLFNSVIYEVRIIEYLLLDFSVLLFSSLLITLKCFLLELDQTFDCLCDFRVVIIWRNEHPINNILWKSPSPE